MYVVNKAYGSKVTAVAAYQNCRRFVSGSDLGHVVVWDVPEPNYVTDVNHVYRHFVLKEHKAEVTCIQIRRDDSECVTSSIDGSCVIWDLELVVFLIPAPASRLHFTLMFRKQVDRTQPNSECVTSNVSLIG